MSNQSTNKEVLESSTKKAKKDKVSSILESLSKLSAQRVLYTGNHRALESIKKVEARLLDLLKEVKQN